MATSFRNGDAAVRAFNAGAELAAVKATMGEIPFRGKLPVSLPELYPAGHGIQK